MSGNDNMLGDIGDDAKKKSRAIIDVNEDWPWYHRLVANIINASGVFFWVFVSAMLLWQFDNNPELVGLRNAYLNLVVPHTIYVIFSLVAGITLVSWLSPWFNPSRIMRTGTPLERAMCMGFWGMIAIAISISLLSVA